MVTLPAWFGTALLQCSFLIRSQIGGLAALLPRDLALLIHLVFISDLLTLTSKIMSHAQVMHDSCPWFMIRLIMIHDSGPGFMLSCYPPKELGLLELPIHLLISDTCRGSEQLGILVVGFGNDTLPFILPCFCSPCQGFMSEN